MTVESAEDRSVFVADFGVDIVWTRAGVPQPAFKANFDRPSTMISHGDGASTLNRVATLSCPEASLPAGAAEDDPIAVAGADEDYACSEIRPDGTGWAVVDLKRV